MRNDPSCLAWLAIIGSSLDPLTIDSMLRLPPALTHSGKSQLTHSRSKAIERTSTKDRWEVKFEIGDDKSLEEYLDAIESIFPSDSIVALKSLSHEADVVFEFEIFRDAGIAFSESFLKFVSDCGGSLDIDVLY
jgi:hypothetical protein